MLQSKDIDSKVVLKKNKKKNEYLQYVATGDSL